MVSSGRRVPSVTDGSPSGVPAAHTPGAARAAGAEAVAAAGAPHLPAPQETPQERHQRRLAWGAEWSAVARELAAKRRQK